MHGRLPVWISPKLLLGGGVHRPPLEHQARDARLAEEVHVGRLNARQIPLGVDVEPHGLGHAGVEPRSQFAGCCHLVGVVDALIRSIVWQVMEHVAKVVEQGGHDERVVSAVTQGTGGCLEGVLPLVDRLAAIFRVTLLGEHSHNRRHWVVCHRRHRSPHVFCVDPLSGESIAG